jgi:BirA family biotin operon repressor/biotin-[acetyl-CoA-carboxylase] ligase
MQETRARVLETIADGTVTGPKIADELDISRAAVWKHIEALREAGFTITSDDAGYTLESIPEYGEAVEFGLDAPFEVEYHESIDSTNRRARELAAEGRRDVVVLSDEQTGGRGRLDRSWASPSGGIWLSILLGPAVPTAHAPIYTLAAAVATAEAVRDLGVDAAIKWPNDVLVDGQKLTGILTEMEGEADRISWLAIGLGLNANVDPEEVPASDATTLRAECGDVNRRALTQEILERFYALHENRDAVVPAWRDRSATLGQRVRVDTPDGEIVGEAVDISFPGTLQVDTDDGPVTVAAGDCEHLRPVED